jgi:hypothetical protein
MDFFLKTPWKYGTSEENSTSLLLSYSAGRLFMHNEDDRETMTINYRCLSIGAGKGPPFGFSVSRTQDPSGGFDNVGVRPNHYFGPMAFPCRGYMIGVGASAAILGSILGMDVSGGGVTVVIFSQVPVFAGLRIWGTGRALFPGAGFTGGLAHYWIE